MKKVIYKSSSSSSGDYSDHASINFTGYGNVIGSIQSLFLALDNSDDLNILQILNQLAIELAILQEELLAAMPLDQLVCGLVSCVQRDHFPDIVLQAISCLMTLIDILPSLSSLLISRGGITVLSTRLQNFEFIDIAEQSIKLLEKISNDSTNEIIMQGLFENMIGTIEFYDKDTQKRI